MEVNRTRYTPWPTILGMAERPPTPDEIVWENVFALMVHHWGGENLNRLAREAKIGPGTATRIKSKKNSARIGTLAKLAKPFKLQPWHLLIPDLDPANPPVEFLTRDQVLALTPLRKQKA